jgi:hypothetical protein
LFGTFQSDSSERPLSDFYFFKHETLQEETALLVKVISAGIKVSNEFLLMKQSPKANPPYRKESPTLATFEKSNELPGNKTDIIAHSFINLSVKTQQDKTKNTALLSIASFIRNGILRI